MCVCVCVCVYICRRYGWFTWRGMMAFPRANPLKGPWVERSHFQLRWAVRARTDRWHKPHRYSSWRPRANVNASCASSLIAQECPEGPSGWPALRPGHGRHPWCESCSERKQQAASNSHCEPNVTEMTECHRRENATAEKGQVRELSVGWYRRLQWQNCLHYIVVTFG